MKILLVCTGNTCRSSMAEGIFNKLIKDLGDKAKDIEVQSAGTWALDGSKPSRNAIIAMKERGIDIAQQKSTPLTNTLVEKSDLILTMTQNHKKQIIDSLSEVNSKVFTLKEYIGNNNDDLDIIDPYGGSLDIYKACANEIEKALKKVIEKIGS